MPYKTGETVTADFCVLTPSTGAAVNADSLPAGTLVKNGVDDAAVVTVTNKATGNYKAAVVLPAVTDGDTLQLRVTTTVATVVGKAVIWSGEGTAVRQTGDSYARIGATGTGLTAVALAATGLDNVLVSNKTLPQAVRIISAVVAGELSGSETNTEVFTDFQGTPAVTVTTDAAGNRPTVIYS